MGTINQLIRNSAVIVLMIIMLGTALIIALISTTAGWRIFRSWCVVALKIFGIEVESQFDSSPSQFDDGGVLVGLNQQSLLDPTVGYAAWDRRLMSIWNIEYALIPFFGWITVLLGWIIIRQNPQQSKAQLGKAAQHAAQGGLVYLSAEGQRSLDGSLNPYKRARSYWQLNLRHLFTQCIYRVVESACQRGSGRFAPEKSSYITFHPFQPEASLMRIAMCCWRS